MDLLKEEDISRNKQVIGVGYGWRYENDPGISRPLEFTRLNMFMMPNLDLNVTIFSSDPYAKTCHGRSSSTSIA